MNDAVTHREPESGSLTDRLGGEERLEQLGFVLRRATRARVFDFEMHLIVLIERADNDAARLGRAAAHGLLGIDEEIQDDLLELGEHGLCRPAGAFLTIEADTLL